MSEALDSLKNEWRLTAAQRAYLPFKRLFDIVFSLAALVVLSPLFLVAAAVIKLDSPGPVFYKHKRIGRGGEAFTLYKFRTMVRDADDRPKYLSPEQQMELDREYKLKSDPRVTKAGRSMRKNKIDEIPQFFNVLKGDLSLIGPRPVVEDEVLKYDDGGRKLLSIKPGITGYWQVNAQSDSCYAQRIQMELRYVDIFSPAVDFVIFFKTFGVILRGTGI